MRLEGYFSPYKSLIFLVFFYFLPTFHSNLKNLKSREEEKT